MEHKSSQKIDFVNSNRQLNNHYCQDILTPNLENITKKSFFGVGFGSKVPIDILPILNLSSFIPDFSLLIVDEFLKLNGLEENFVNSACNQFLETVNKLRNIYRTDFEIILCSDFMQSKKYEQIFQSLKNKIEKNHILTDLILETVPENKLDIPSAREYPIHEFACVKYLINQGYSLKIGPSKEKSYDQIIQKFDFDIDFAYILDAFALGTKFPDKVVHYIPNSKGPNQGQRIFFGDEERIVKSKLQQGCDEALRYFCKIASVSGYLLDKRYFDLKEISTLYGKKLKRETINLVFDNIIKPYREIK